MVKRVCRDCPIQGCGAKYLVRLANHLADVHFLDINQRRKYLQEAKLQPKVKFVVYQDTTNGNNTDRPAQNRQKVYELSLQQKQHNIRKTASMCKNKRKAEKNYKVREELKNWLIKD